MKFTVCPECREVIGDDELRGSSKICHACARRTDRSDLIEIDTEKTEEEDSKLSIHAPLGANGESFDPNEVAEQPFSTRGNAPELTSELDKVLPHSQYLIDIPVIHSLDELHTISKAHWEYDTEIRDSEYLRTLVTRQPVGIIDLILGTFFVGWAMLILFMTRNPEFIIVLMFGGIGAWFLYCALMTRTKVWIRIFRDRLEIHRGFRKNGKYRIYNRSYQDTPVNIVERRSKNSSSYKVVILNGSESYILVSALSSFNHSYAEDYKRMIETILKAKL